MKKKDELKWSIISNGILLIFALAAVLPFILLVMASISNENIVMTNGYSFLPQGFSLDAYRYIFSQAGTIGRGYINTMIVTLIGTALSMLITSMFAYALSNERLPGAKILNFLCIFTMLFSGGQVASYYVWSRIFNIRDTIWGLVFPNLLMNAFNVVLVKNYFTFSIPSSLKEAARIDGCGEFKIFWKIVMPLSIPINATIGLMTGLIYWNDWVNGLYYLTARDGSKFYTIQIILNQINDNITWLASGAAAMTTVSTGHFPTTTTRMAIAVIGIVPIMIIYPFLQRYFVKGITIGAVKE